MIVTDEQCEDYEFEERMYFLQRQYEEYIKLSKDKREEDTELGLAET